MNHKTVITRPRQHHGLHPDLRRHITMNKPLWLVVETNLGSVWSVQQCDDPDHQHRIWVLKCNEVGDPTDEETAKDKRSYGGADEDGWVVEKVNTMVIAEPLDKHEILLVRACKCDGNRMRRLQKIFGWHYAMDRTYAQSADIARVLLEVLRKTGRLDTWRLICEFAPDQEWKFQSGIERLARSSYWDRLCLMLISKIKHTPVYMIPGFIDPLKFRIEKAGLK